MGALAATCTKMHINIQSIFRFHRIKVAISSHHILKSHYRSSKSTRLLATNYYRPPVKHKKRNVKESEEVEDEENDSDNLTEESKLDKLLERDLLPSTAGHQVFVIQPFIKWGVQKKRNTTPDLQLLESVTLIKTLRQYTVVDQRIVSLQFIRRNTVFGSGVLKDLQKIISSNSKISAVFISLNTLSMCQQMFLQETFGVPVFDRYSVIMHIFKEHAQTKEAKLQVQLAQLPYLWTVLRGVGGEISKNWAVSKDYFGAGDSTLAYKKTVFKRRAAKLKREILELREERALMRKKRERQEIPVVAVIGYTNAGKTSLVKALTGSRALEPQDYLFATLDVTSHLGELPSGLKAYFIDTLGFINDIPTYLIESFVSTLEDAVLANVIIHVRDVSHPDTVAQNDKVIEILKNLDIPEETMQNVITVGNKIDLVERSKLENFKDLILVSSMDLTGIDVLRGELEKKILQLTDLTRIIIRVRSGGPEYFWLHEKATIVTEIPDNKDNQYILLETLITSVTLSKFKHNFITKYKKQR